MSRTRCMLMALGIVTLAVHSARAQPDGLPPDHQRAVRAYEIERNASLKAVTSAMERGAAVGDEAVSKLDSLEATAARNGQAAADAAEAAEADKAESLGRLGEYYVQECRRIGVTLQRARAAVEHHDVLVESLRVIEQEEQNGALRYKAATKLAEKLQKDVDRVLQFTQSVVINAAINKTLRDAKLELRHNKARKQQATFLARFVRLETADTTEFLKRKGSAGPAEQFLGVIDGDELGEAWDEALASWAGSLRALLERRKQALAAYQTKAEERWSNFFDRYPQAEVEDAMRVEYDLSAVISKITDSLDEQERLAEKEKQERRRAMDALQEQIAKDEAKLRSIQSLMDTFSERIVLANNQAHDADVDGDVKAAEAFRAQAEELTAKRDKWSPEFVKLDTATRVKKAELAKYKQED